MSDGYEDLPHLFGLYGFHERASALRRLIAERDALLLEAVKSRKQETEKADERLRAELEEIQIAYATVAEIRGKAKAALVRYGHHRPDCRTRLNLKEPSYGWGPGGPPNHIPCDCGFERLLQGGL